MDTILLLPIGISFLTGISLIIWSFFEHQNSGSKFQEKHLRLVHFLSVASLLITAFFVGFLCLGEDREVTLFYLMKDIPIYFRIDEISRWFVLTVTIVWVLVGLYSVVYLKHEGEQKRFFGCFLLVYGVLIALDFSGNLVTFYLFYELMTLSSFPLVLHNGSREAIMASLKYLFYSMAGAYMGLFGIFFLQSFLGDLTFTAGGILSGEVMKQQGNMILIAVLMMMIGFGAKAGMFPLHAWLPTAHPVAPSPASAALSGIIVKSGVLGILRVIYYIVGPQNLQDTWVMTVCRILSLITVFMGSLLAFREPVIKKRLAYSTVSQVSYILFGLFLLTPQGVSGALLHVLFHAVIKSGLFLVAGIFLFECKITEVSQCKGLGKKMPITLWCYTIFSLALVGIPPTSGFVSKWHLAQGALSSGTGVFEIVGPVVLLLSALLTAGYLLPISLQGFFPGKEVDQQTKKEPALLMLLPVIVLAALALGFGILPNFLTEYAHHITQILW